MVNLDLAQSLMRSNAINGWLVYDFRGNNPVMWYLLGGRSSTTRGSFLFIPSIGIPKVLAHILDRDQFTRTDLDVELYTTWVEMQSGIRNTLNGYSRVAMEYTPGANLPSMSWVDGGMIESIRALGVEVVSSANLFQVAAASWTEAALISHKRASSAVMEIKDLAFNYIRSTLEKSATFNEYMVQEFIMEEFRRRGLETEDLPVVAVNTNSGNPHYEPSAKAYQLIKKGDWVLIDLWARNPGDENVFADITWVGYVGEHIPDQYIKVFNIVREARDRVVTRLKDAWSQRETLQGWQLDVVARNCITYAGYEKYFIHRTGHSIGPGSTLHALGVNLDNFETHDTREIIPGIGFSVEPGIYLPEFGVRLEINVYVDLEKGPVVTTPPQDAIIRLI